MTTIIVLILGLFISSWSSIIIRLIGDVHPLVISFYRLILSALLFLPFLKKKDLINVQGRHTWSMIILAGFFLAMHFYSWIASLQMTTVGNSIFLVSTNPIFALVFSIIFLNEKADKKFILVILLGLAGMLLTVSIDFNTNTTALSGDLLAILGAVFIAAYLIIARKTSRSIPLIPYLTLVYAIAAGFIFIIILFKQISILRLSDNVWIWLIILAVGPNFIGHSILNWASRRIPVYIVNTALLPESVLATTYAAILLNEIPPIVFYPGAVVIIFSVFIALWIKRKSIN